MIAYCYIYIYMLENQQPCLASATYLLLGDQQPCRAGATTCFLQRAQIHFRLRHKLGLAELTLPTVQHFTHYYTHYFTLYYNF